ncbi:MAG: hypothetical protein ACOC10_06965 [Bacteroidota bacterium]
MVLYNSSTKELYSDAYVNQIIIDFNDIENLVYNSIWKDGMIVHKAIDIEFKTDFETFNYTNDDFITINNKSYLSQSHNFTEFNFKNLLNEFFEYYYLLDLPYLPPLDKMIYQVTGIFLK